MKILMIIGTGAILTFPTVDHKVYDPNPDCFTQGYKVLQKLATYQGPEEKGEDQGWYLNGTKILVAGFYCQ
jgi:hypothetical protein